MMKATGCRAPWSLVVMSVIVLFATACTSPSKEFMKAQEDDTRSSYRRFLAQYPSGTFSDKAKTRIAEIDRDKKERAEEKAEQEAFAFAVRRGDEAALRQYLTQYPGPVFINAAHASEISARLADIEREKQKQAEQDAFTSAKRTGTVEAYEGFLDTWPNSTHEQEAQQGLKETRDYAEWRKVDAIDAGSLQAYIAKFPAGPHSKSAKALLTMNQRLAAFRNKTVAPRFAMTIGQLGSLWEKSKKHVYEENLCGIAFLKAGVIWKCLGIPRVTAEALGMETEGCDIMGFRPLGLGHDSSFGVAGNNIMLPTRDGQILAINTGGTNTRDLCGRVLGGFHFITPESSVNGLACQPGPPTGLGPLPVMGLEGVVFFGVLERLSHP